MQKDGAYLKAMLRSVGCKATPRRMAVLGLMHRAIQPLSVEDIMRGIKTEADQATVYRTVKLLESRGIIRQVDLRHHHAHYELADDKDHHHVICTVCGRIEDVTHCALNRAYNAVLRGARHFAEIRQHALEFFGVCKTCAG